MKCPICKEIMNRSFGLDEYSYKCESLHYSEVITPLVNVTKVGNKEMDISITEPSNKRWSKHLTITRWIRKSRKEWLSER